MSETYRDDDARHADRTVVALPQHCHGNQRGPSPDNPPLVIGSERGRWRCATGDDGWPRGVYAWIDEQDGGPEWLRVAVLPHVHQVTHHPEAPQRLQVLYHLSEAADPDPTDPGAVAACTRGEIRSGKWAEKVDVPLSGEPAVVRAAGRAILALAESGGGQ